MVNAITTERYRCLPLGLIWGGGMLIGGNPGQTAGGGSPSLGIGGGLPQRTLTGWWFCHGACGEGGGGRGGGPFPIWIFPDSAITFCSFPTRKIRRVLQFMLRKCFFFFVLMRTIAHEAAPYRVPDIPGANPPGFWSKFRFSSKRSRGMIWRERCDIVFLKVRIYAIA